MRYSDEQAVYEFEKTDEGLRIIGFEERSTDIVIPSEVEGEPVTSISRGAFSGNRVIRSIRFPETIASIDKKAFENCRGLVKVEFPDTFDTYDRSWFVGCRSLVDITLPGSIPYLDAEMLGDLKLTALGIGSGTHFLGDVPFSSMPLERVTIHPGNECLKCDGHGIVDVQNHTFVVLAVQTKRYSIPEGCLTVGNKAFSYSRVIEHVDVPEGVFELCENAFSNSSISSVSLPSTLAFIGKHAFLSCANLAHLDLPPRLFAIYDGAFESSGLEGLTIPASVANLGQDVFLKTRVRAWGDNPTLVLEENPSFAIDEQGALYEFLEDGTKVLKEFLNYQADTLVVAPGTTVIAEGACQRRKLLRTVVLPEGLTTIEIRAFNGCSALEFVSDCPTLQTIEDYAFFGTKLKSLHLPAAFKSLGDFAIVTCFDYYHRLPPTLHDVTVDDGCMTFWTEQDMLCERRPDGSVRVHLYYGSRSEIYLGDHITSIAPYAFCCVTGIRSMRLHEGLNDVGYRGLTIYDDLTYVELKLAEPIDGRDTIVLDFLKPDVGANTLFEFMRTGRIRARDLMEAYDGSLGHIHTPFERTRRMTERLHDPFLLNKTHHDSFVTFVTNRLSHTFRVFAQNDYTEGFDMLYDLGYLNEGNISEAIDIASAVGSVSIAGHLLQMQFERFGKDRLDFEL